jgi:hypothetical protein
MITNPTVVMLKPMNEILPSSIVNTNVEEPRIGILFF